MRVQVRFPDSSLSSRPGNLQRCWAKCASAYFSVLIHYYIHHNQDSRCLSTRQSTTLLPLHGHGLAQHLQQAGSPSCHNLPNAMASLQKPTSLRVSGCLVSARPRRRSPRRTAMFPVWSMEDLNLDRTAFSEAWLELVAQSGSAAHPTVAFVGSLTRSGSMDRLHCLFELAGRRNISMN